MESNNNKIAIWGGVECTAARVQNKLYDQLQLNGHEQRIDDLLLFEDLGIKTIRYPLLWEKAFQNEECFFELHKERFEKLNELQIEPIAGLMHHGSGPPFTSLMDPNYPELLAEYGEKVAKKFPFIRLFTPVNEPLTTARFSGLYGVWYPHNKDDQSFVRIFINEMKAIVLTMQRIRQIRPDAGLIQTEDLCKIKSTTLLQYQTNFENHRRWLTYDFLTGRFDKNHPLWSYFRRNNVSEKELEFFQFNKTIPEICGFNYYVTSERFLDHRLSLYPEHLHGGNGIHLYVDVETVRIDEQKLIGSKELLKEAWQRYNLPMAITEVHLSCTREEQLRWFYESYHAGLELKKEGIDFRAVTAWSFLGSFDWNSLLRRKRGYYETGVYDIRSGMPRPTAIAKLIKALNHNESYYPDLLKMPGWWNRKTRILFSETRNRTKMDFQGEMKLYNHLSPLLVLDSNESMGKAFAKICTQRGINFKIAGNDQIDITSKDSIESYLNKVQPWAVINALGFSDIDEAEKQPKACFAENTIGPSILAEICHSSGIQLVSFSTDQVFNGKKRNPYREDDPTSPLNIYGQSKRMAEKRILSINPDTLIIRSSSSFNPWHFEDSVAQLIRNSRNMDSQQLFASDIIISPTYIPDLVNSTLDLLIDKESGIWHLSNEEEYSYYDFAKLALKIYGISDENIYSAPSSFLKYTAERPAYSVLMSSQGIKLPPLDQALQNYIRELKEVCVEISQTS